MFGYSKAICIQTNANGFGYDEFNERDLKFIQQHIDTQTFIETHTHTHEKYEH